MNEIMLYDIFCMPKYAFLYTFFFLSKGYNYLFPNDKLWKEILINDVEFNAMFFFLFGFLSINFVIRI